MRFAILGSGSKGNCVVVQGGGVTLLIDAGFAARETRRRMRSLDTDLDVVSGLLITHGHGDHVKGARQLARALNVPTYCTEGTQAFCARAGGLDNREIITAGATFDVAALKVTAIGTVHDAKGSVCFVVDDGDERLCVVTDLGTPTMLIGDALATCDAIVVEHNHDAEMLRKGPYPQHLKRRIGSPYGHLNNDDGTKLVAHAMRAGRPSRVLLAHLSEVNNTPALAMASCRRAVDGHDVQLAVCPQHHPTGWLRVKRARNPHHVAATHKIIDGLLLKADVPRPVAAAPAAIPPPPPPHVALVRQLKLFEAPASSGARGRR